MFNHVKTDEVTSLSTVLQKCWQKSGGIPFGPGAFRAAICFKAIKTSSSLNSRVSEEFISFEITCGTWSRTLLRKSVVEEEKSSW